MNLFVFGSTGDLFRRKAISALEKLSGFDLFIYALGRRSFTKEVYQEFACSDKCSKEFKEKLFYLEVNFDDENVCSVCEKYFDKEKTNYFYISLPPNMTMKIITSMINYSKMGYRIKILLEKPFGENYSSAKAIQRKILESSFENNVYLADHYLFKKNILKIQRKEFNKLKIVSLETLGLESRTAYYDTTGAINDMVQSHLINIAIKILGNSKTLKNYTLTKFIKGQYQGYSTELKAPTKIETFTHIIIEYDFCEIEMITGKAFDKKISYVEIDGKRTNIDTEGENPYEQMFTDFFNENKTNFPKIEDTLTSWEVVGKIKKHNPNLVIYPKNFPAEKAQTLR
jgi:glucose-6-phosphate 1-dehydrogenase